MWTFDLAHLPSRGQVSVVSGAISGTLSQILLRGKLYYVHLQPVAQFHGQSVCEQLIEHKDG